MLYSTIVDKNEEGLQMVIEAAEKFEQVIAEGADKDVVEKIVRLKRGAAFKAAQIPPIFNISEKPLGLKDKWLL